MASTPNVTMLMFANSSFKGGKEEFCFVLSHTCSAPKRKDREKECASGLAAALDPLPLEDMRAWCQMPEASQAKREVDAADLEQLTALVARKCPKVSLELPEPTTCVLVASIPWGPHERAHGQDPDLAVLEKFDAGFAELLKEARRVSGLVRKQWYLAVVWARVQSNGDASRFALGTGLATDRHLS